MRRLYQCPGCWSYGTHEPVADGWLECNCGEAMTMVDLREDRAPSEAVVTVLTGVRDGILGPGALDEVIDHLRLRATR